MLLKNAKIIQKLLKLIRKLMKNVTCGPTFSLKNTVLEKLQERGRDQTDPLPSPLPKCLQVAGKLFATQCFFHKSFESEN